MKIMKKYDSLKSSFVVVFLLKNINKVDNQKKKRYNFFKKTVTIIIFLQNNIQWLIAILLDED